MKKILLGNEAINKAVLAVGVSYVSGYPGCPSAEINDGLAKIAKENNIYVEWATNEKTGLESAIGASFSGLRSLVSMKSFGINVCSDSLLPLVYTGVKAGMVIVVLLMMAAAGKDAATILGLICCGMYVLVVGNNIRTLKRLQSRLNR